MADSNNFLYIYARPYIYIDGFILKKCYLIRVQNKLKRYICIRRNQLSSDKVNNVQIISSINVSLLTLFNHKIQNEKGS